MGKSSADKFKFKQSKGGNVNIKYRGLEKSKNNKWGKIIFINKIHNPKLKHYSHEHLHFKC